MAKIPFSTEYRPQIESGEYKVETRSGKQVRIVCWDRLAVTIIALIGDSEDIVTYNLDGTTGQQMKLPSDLFIITPEPELTKFEKAIKNLCWNVGMGEVVYKDDIIKKTAAELLNLARKELIEEQYTSDPCKTNLYKLGKAEALKDLPRWRVSKAMRSTMPTIMCSDRGMLLYKDGFEVTISDLEKLPKED